MFIAPPPLCATALFTFGSLSEAVDSCFSASEQASELCFETDGLLTTCFPAHYSENGADGDGGRRRFLFLIKQFEGCF